MLPLPPFALESPDQLDDLLALAATPGSRLLAGGTDLVPSLKHRLFEPRTLVALAGVGELHGVVESEGWLGIGAGETLRSVRRHPVVREQLPALAQACGTVATSTIQAMATLGGNLMLDTRCAFYNQPQGWRDSIGGCLKAAGSVCHVARTGTGCYAAHSADTVPVLWLMGAEVELVSTRSRRRVPVQDLYDGLDGRRWLRTEPGEVVLRVWVPLRSGAIAYRKVRRRGAIDYGALLVGVRREGLGAVAVIGAVGPAPMEVRVPAAAELPDRAWEAVKPLNTHVVATSWRRHMVRVSVRRALESLS
jgi:4-hydroxybenzoyl-CoA reductase subunit beta